jgi:sugar lactone lactonase YvrE
MLKRAAVLFAVVIALIAAYLLLWPVPVDPVVWDPPEAPALTGPYAPDTPLAPKRRLLEGFGEGPEDVAFDEEGLLYTGVGDGRIARIDPVGGEPEVFADTGGRPLGMVFDGSGDLIVADADKALIAVAPDGTITTLTSEIDGEPIPFADDLDIAPDGIIYFSDASTKFSLGDDILDIVEHGGNGRLLAYDPATRSTRLLLDGLQFANGVAVAPDGSYVLVAETGAYRIRRVWLEGEHAGTTDTFYDNLPGFPDNINFNGRGTVWVAMPGIRSPSLDAMGQKPFLRKLTVRLPVWMQPVPPRYGLVLEIGADGRPIRSLHDPSGEVANITSVTERGSELFLGSHMEHHITVVGVEVPDPPPEPEMPEDGED